MLLETNYRERLHMVTNEVKRRLDYQIALQDLHRRMEQEHMVNWVEKSVIGSITPQQVSVFMSKCREPPAERCFSVWLLTYMKSFLFYLYSRLNFNKQIKLLTHFYDQTFHFQD